MRSMKRALAIGVVTLITAAICTVASADMCKKCADMMFTADIGTCAQCKAHTSSGGKKLCPACSKKLGECEACRCKLAATTQPATQPGK